MKGRMNVILGRIFSGARRNIHLNSFVSQNSFRQINPPNKTAWRALHTPSRQTFKLKFNDVTRDLSQGKYANRIPLDHPLVLKTVNLWDELNKHGSELFGCFEMGGASVQVDENFLRKNYTQTARAVRKAAPNTAIRPLWRGANSFLLKPAHRYDLFWILKQFADDVAPKDAKKNELLRIKVFDSQGINQEIESTVAMVALLLEQGYPVSVEIAIPYSNGEGRDSFNPYPDKLFIDRVLEAAELSRKYGIPSHLFRVSLKDMVGELQAGKAGRLVSGIIQGLKEKELSTELGLHLHDTGLALDAYVEAIKVSQEEAWPINVDTVSGFNSGFVNILELISCLELEGIRVGVTREQEKLLKQMNEINTELQEQYEAARVPRVFHGEHLRRYGIPGGGEASFVNAVKAGGLAAQLKVSEQDALHILGSALIKVGSLMGHAFPVTPGFQNKQIAALNLVNNLIRGEQLTLGDRYAIEKRILTLSSDEEIRQFFLKNLNPVVQEFLKGEMPAEVHPVIRQSLGRRNKLLTDDLEAQLPEAMDVVRKLQEEGVLELDEKAFNEAVARALIVGPKQFPALARNPYLGREVDPTKYATPQEWEAAKKRTSEILGAGVPMPYAETATRLERFFNTASDPASWQVLVPAEKRGLKR